MEQSYIQVCDVEKYYGSGTAVAKAVDRVSFRVDRGEFVGVMGASGSGKTTLLNMLSTIDSVTAGHIYYENVDITELSENKLSKFRKENLGFVFQEYNLLDTLTIEENILLALSLHQREKREVLSRCREMLDLLGIADIRDKFPYQVSGGQKQRCACARALVNRPKLLLADEPTGALDSRSAQTLLETFTDMNGKLKATIFMVTHDAFSASYCYSRFMHGAGLFAQPYLQASGDAPASREVQTMEQSYIQVCDVEKYYGSGTAVAKAVDRVSFRVDRGEFVGVMGASGSGKTTLLNMLSTIDSVTAGHIYYENVDITELSENKLSKFRKENLGFVFQEYNLLDTLTIEENILLALSLHQREKREVLSRCREMLDLLGIADIRDKFPYQVSGGQKQRCACARALVNRPKLLLADEPTGALDSRSAQTLLETFTDMNGKLKATIFMVTHDAFSASYCGRILFLKDGQIFHELRRGRKSRREFLNEILDVLSLTGGELSDAQ